MNNLFSLKHKVIAISGGYGHLGRSISEGLAYAGASVMVLGRSKEKFDTVFEKSKNIYFISCDVSSIKSVQLAYKSIINRHSKIDVLINNAHYGAGGMVDEISDEAWNITMDGTVGNAHRCIREILPYFRKQGLGRVINVSSMYGVVAPDFAIYKEYEHFTNPPHYGAGKAAMIQLTKYFASLLGKENILVNCVSPGAFPSKEVQKNKGFIQNLGNKNPLGRIGQPEELQGVCIFLSSPASTYITGQNISVDGGWTII